ncbi:hypothetical protein SAMN05216553_118166 [Lentzea fradiae]|uniref:Uncharacterized protein n=1 Tax=Lentzea fradiae TaxID=200378 RepID=A0A1G8AWZ7_9PSEU|nr:hypothetical protein SAMN05216553_118166 [Lentzea fradiae]
MWVDPRKLGAARQADVGTATLGEDMKAAHAAGPNVSVTAFAVFLESRT